jgi:hypothetical protein
MDHTVVLHGRYYVVVRFFTKIELEFEIGQATSMASCSVLVCHPVMLRVCIRSSDAEHRPPLWSSG